MGDESDDALERVRSFMSGLARISRAMQSVLEYRHGLEADGYLPAEDDPRMIGWAAALSAARSFWNDAAEEWHG